MGTPRRSRKNSLATLAETYLAKHPEGATLAEIQAALQRQVDREVLGHSLRASMYRRISPAGEPVFERIGRGRYRIRRQ